MHFLQARFSIVFLIITHVVTGQNYSATMIPDSLKEAAFAVIRENTREIKLQSLNKGTEKVRRVVTVLDNNGDGSGVLRVFYDKDSKVTIRTINLYDGTGKRIKKINPSDAADVPANDGVALYSDNRMKIYNPNYGNYPYTVEYEYQTDFTNMISYGRWFPLYGYNVALEKARLSFVHPPEIKYRKMENNLCTEPTNSKVDDAIEETWTCNSIKAIENEPYDLSLSERVPRVILMPVNLKYDEFSGNAENWKAYGNWINELYKGRDLLPEPLKSTLFKLTENTPDTLDRIRLLYKYLQENTRYIGVQLGIGGLQPFSAETVSATGYGDCKALTNFMKAMLSVFGINSYPALVSSGTYIEKIYKDFPNFQQFDHVILCVPFRHDTIWLECTNQNTPFGFLGSFTDNRDVLLITKEGGIIAHTEIYKAEDNKIIEKGIFTIDEKGAAECSLETTYEGLQYDNISQIFSLSAEDRKKWVYQTNSFPGAQLIDLKFTRPLEQTAEGTIKKIIRSDNYCSFTGPYMLIPLNLVNQASSVQKAVKPRKSDFIIHRSTIDFDTLTYIIPAGYKVAALPTGKEIKSPFGAYSFAVNQQNDRIVYSRRLEIIEGRFSAAEYRKFYEFFSAVSKADKEKIMLTKQ